MIIMHVAICARAWFGSHISHYPWHETENTRRVAFQPPFTSGMQLHSVLSHSARCACVHTICCVEFYMEIHDRMHGIEQRNIDIKNTVCKLYVCMYVYIFRLEIPNWEIYVINYIRATLAGFSGRTSRTRQCSIPLKFELL